MNFEIIIVSIGCFIIGWYAGRLAESWLILQKIKREGLR